MTDIPPDPPPGDPPPSPYNHSDGDIRQLCTCWHLTEQQQRALPLLLQWKVPKQIAQLMALSTSSVRNMIQAICKRVGIEDGADGIRQRAAATIASHQTYRARERARAIEWERRQNERKEP